MVLQTKKVILSFLVLLAIFLPAKILAATLSVLPSVANVTVGQTVTLSVRAASVDRALNAIAGVINYPADKLEALSVGKTGSILSYWITEPTAVGGQIKFEGVVPNPGFTGASGNVLTVTFRARVAGEAPLTFTSGSVLANDGLGTEILTGMFPAMVTIRPAVALPPPPESTVPAADFAPPAGDVTSSTHPDPTKWYNHNDPIFAWKLAAEIDGVNILADKIANSNPGSKSDGLLKSHQYDDVADGKWYFHLRLHNSQGWGGITHFGFNVDTAKPEDLKVELVPRTDPSDPRLGVRVMAGDKTSGIEHYEFSLDGEAPVEWRDDGSQIYRFVATSGGHSMMVKVYDRAGNYLQETLDFTVEKLEPPRLTDYPSEVIAGETLSVAGETYPDVVVNLSLVNELGEKIDFVTRSNNLGQFRATTDRKPKEGVYQLSAYVTDERGAQSAPSIAITIPVVLPQFMKFGLNTLNALAIFVPILAMLLLIIFLIWYAWHKMKTLRKRVRKESREAEEALHQAFALLRTDLAEGVERLESASDKRELTKDEKALLRQFRKSLDEAEKFVHKEIVDIEKEVD